MVQIDPLELLAFIESGMSMTAEQIASRWPEWHKLTVAADDRLATESRAYEVKWGRGARGTADVMVDNRNAAQHHWVFLPLIRACLKQQPTRTPPMAMHNPQLPNRGAIARLRAEMDGPDMPGGYYRQRVDAILALIPSPDQGEAKDNGLGVSPDPFRVETPLALGPQLSAAAKRRLEAVDQLDRQSLARLADFQVGASFSFHDEEGDHDPCYVVLPGGGMLSLCHNASELADVAAAVFIVKAANAALATPPVDSAKPGEIERARLIIRNLLARPSSGNQGYGAPVIKAMALKFLEDTGGEA